jgi:putative ABC transport system substrate-binding protein
MQRRQFLGLLGAAATQWPVRANAARKAGGPVIGFLNSSNSRGMAYYFTAFHGGLKSTGFVKDQNVRFSYAWANGDYAQLPGLAGRLVQDGVDVIASSGGLVAANAAVDATRDIPVVFLAGLDPRSVGFRPQTNVTGIITNTPDQLLQRLEALRNLVPGRTVALLVNPANSPIAVIEQPKALLSGVPILRATNMTEVEQAFKEAGANRYAMLVSSDPIYTANRERIAPLEFKYGVPAGYAWAEYLRAGGFSAHGPDLRTGYQTLGRYVGEVLRQKGLRRGATNDLAVASLQLGPQRINPDAARRHGIVIPTSLRDSVRRYRTPR